MLQFEDVGYSKNDVFICTRYFKLFKTSDLFKKIFLNILKKRVAPNDSVYLIDEKCSDKEKTNSFLNIDNDLWETCASISQKTKTKQMLKKQKRQTVLNQYEIVVSKHLNHLDKNYKSLMEDGSFFYYCDNIVKLKDIIVKNIYNHFEEHYLKKQWCPKYKHIYTKHEESEIVMRKPLIINVHIDDFDFLTIEQSEFDFLNEHQQKTRVEIPVCININHPFDKLKSFEKKSFFEPKIKTKTEKGENSLYFNFKAFLFEN